MKIRDAELKDIDNLYELLRQVQQLHAEGRPDIFISETNKYSVPVIREILSEPKTPVYVAVDECDQVIGYAFCVVKEEKGSENLRAIKTFYIDDLCIGEKYRGKGLGTALYNHVLEKAKEFGCYHLTLNVWHLNQTAVKFYEKLGMKPLKTTMEKIL